ncbi:MAG: hypothetical protein MR630_11625 [Selenomonas sp.]|uniref:hypothetical protein n=1 Tax=Selenomonas sp. TaxID=2053611 RepID=UPI0025ED1EFE|nr:hypothetical protein [Selenomonas sp.]MCI6099097.1 hypothetical protein [Selenomonas sp.]MCI6233239.1 hypothetical protein [Selenomonas sp.]MDD6127603.1 hypothetical protein [Veillonellaceae bacterium]
MRWRKTILILVVLFAELFNFPTVGNAETAYLKTDQFVSMYNRYVDWYADKQKQSPSTTINFSDLKIYSLQTTEQKNVAFTILPSSVIMYIVEYKTGEVAGVAFSYMIYPNEDKKTIYNRAAYVGAAAYLSCNALGVPSDENASIVNKIVDIAGKSYKNLEQPFKTKVYNQSKHRNMVMVHEFNKEDKAFELSIFFE